MPTAYRQTQTPESRKAAHNAAMRASRPVRPFVGVDGEGGDIYGSHEYLLLRAGDQVLETGEPLTWEECLWFLSELPSDVIYVSYYFDYDVTMMVRRMPEERLRRLMDRESRTDRSGMFHGPMPIDIGNYQVDYLPHKEFRVRRRIDTVAHKRRYTKWVVISDVGSFFQSSFVSALRKWYGSTDSQGEWTPNPGESHMAAVIDKIEEGKSQRNAFGRVTQYEREYNLLECKVLVQLMNKFRTMCHEAGLRPAKWQGPGNLVMAQFRKVGLPKNKDITCFDDYDGLQAFCNAAYYGGRFEACVFGEINGPIYQYDINSAYARTYRDLPCLVHGTWTYVNSHPVSGIYVGDVSYRHATRASIYTLPIRTKKGEILFPRAGRGTYWAPELELARDNGAKLDWHGGWVYTRNCDCANFDWVEELFEERKRLGKDGRGYVLKIMLATIYGKLAQSVGTAPYANPVWSGLIVSTVRAQLCRAALADDSGRGRDVVMLATDGLFCTQARRAEDVVVGKQLGEWELTEHEAMFVVQSGVYMLPEKLPKTRGIAQRKVIQHTWDFYREWRNYYRRGTGSTSNVGDSIPGITVSVRQFIGIKTALARNRLDIAGQWIETDRHITFDWRTKRTSPTVVGTQANTEAPEGSLKLRSMPYKRTIGGASFRDLDDEQPDWSDAL